MKLKINGFSKYAVILLSAFLFSSCSLTNNFKQNNLDLNKSTTPTSTVQKPTMQQDKTLTETNPIVAIKVNDGEIVLRLYKDKAPNTVNNFLNKANSGFYKGLIFHRVEPGFVVQGGDPLGNGTGGGQIKSEINNIPFKRGSVGLARTPATKEVSNDSQFFICLTSEQCSQLTNEYVNFGEVISGFEYLNNIKVGDKIINITTQTK